MNVSENEPVQAELFVDQAKPVATWDALQDLGFFPEADYIGCPAMSYDFGSFKLQAARMVNRYFREVVSFSGFVRTPNSMSSIEFEMPLQVESNEQCAAWIAWHLYNNLPHREKFILSSRCDLLVFGLKHQATLPWERERLVRELEAAEYRARPSCIVDRALIKLGLKTLAKYIETASATDRIEIWFDGQTLSFQINGKKVILQAEGSAWEASYALPAGQLTAMPKRLLSEAVDVSIWRKRLQIDRSRYDEIVELVQGAGCPAQA